MKLKAPMEVSTIVGAGMQNFHVLLPPPLPLSFPLTSSSSPSHSPTRRTKQNRLIYATITSSLTSTSTLVKETTTEQPNNNGQSRVYRRPHSKSYLARKSAILEVQLSPDLDSALSRYLFLPSFIFF